MDNTPFDPIGWLYAGAGSGITALWAWFRQRKKDAAEIKTAEIENVEKAIAIWRNLAQDMRNQVDELKTEVKYLSAEVAKLHGENEVLKQQVEVLQKENHKLIVEINHLKNETSKG